MSEVDPDKVDPVNVDPANIDPEKIDPKYYAPFGAYLVEKGIVSIGELEAALILQEDRNPKLGKLAHRHQLLSFDKICAIREYQRTYDVRFGEAAVRLGFLSDFEVASLIEEQAANHMHIGEMLVELNIMSPLDLRQCFEQYLKTMNEEALANSKAARANVKESNS